MSITLRRDKNSKLTIDELDDNFVSVRPYRIYVANLYQESGENPIATVLDNTIGDRKSTRLNFSHVSESRMPSSA